MATDILKQNNYLWAQLLNRPSPLIQTPIQSPMAFVPFPRGGPMPMPVQPLIPPPPTIPATFNFANHVLQTTRNGRKFEVDGKPLDLTVKFDTLNKKLVGHFDFRSEIKMYYLKAKCSVALGNQLGIFTRNTNAFVNMRVEESVKLEDYYTPAVLPPNDTQQLLSDVIFVANLGVDPVSLERIANKPLLSTFKSRRVVYQKNNTPAFNYSALFSRSRMPPPPQPQPYYNLPQAQQQQYPTTAPTPSYPAHFPSLPNNFPPPPQPQPLSAQGVQPYPPGFYPLSNPPPVPQFYYPPQPQQNFYPPPPPTADAYPPRAKPQQPQQYARPSYVYPGAYPNQPQPQQQVFVPVQPPQIKPVYAAQQQQQKKKNTCDQLPSPLRTLNEDNMVVLLQYLEISDYVHMTQTCRKFLKETLGPNNYLWAQLLNHPMQPQYSPVPSIQYQPYVEVSTQVPATMPPQIFTPLAHMANQVLQTTRNGRKFEVDGKPLDLTVKFDTLNKKLVGHFDFRNEIKMYYLKAKCAVALFNQFNQITVGTNANAVIQVEEKAQLEKYIKKHDPGAYSAVTDVTFVVDLGVDLASFEKLKNNKMPSVYRSRRVVYHKRDATAFNINYMSRARMMPPVPQNPMPHPIPLAYPQPGGMPQPYGALPPLPERPPQIGFRPVQPPTISAYASQVLPPKPSAPKK